MKTKEQILEKINEYYKLPQIQQLHLRNIGFIDALRWVYEDEEPSKYSRYTSIEEYDPEEDQDYGRVKTV